MFEIENVVWNRVSGCFMTLCIIWFILLWRTICVLFRYFNRQRKADSNNQLNDRQLILFV